MPQRLPSNGQWQQRAEDAADDGAVQHPDNNGPFVPPNTPTWGAQEPPAPDEGRLFQLAALAAAAPPMARSRARAPVPVPVAQPDGAVRQGGSAFDSPGPRRLPSHRVNGTSAAPPHRPYSRMPTGTAASNEPWTEPPVEANVLISELALQGFTQRIAELERQVATLERAALLTRMRERLLVDDITNAVIARLSAYLDARDARQDARDDN